MTYPCWSCGGSGEVVVSPDNNPQHDYPQRCGPCLGTGHERCCYCERDGITQAWGKVEPGDKTASLLYYCAAHLEQDRKAGLIVLVVEEPAS